MIFISHNHKDKDVVQPVANILATTFGTENVFYDSWSIQPGDSIIDKMNQGIAKTTCFLLFLSNNALSSEAVKLEWQSTLFKSLGTDIKIIPIKIQECLVPPILQQTVYIDMVNNGFDTAVEQIKDVINGKNTYNSSNTHFENLKGYVSKENNTIIIECKASHFHEPIPDFMILVDNNEEEIHMNTDQPYHVSGQFNDKIPMSNGTICKGQSISGVMPITPNHSLVITISAKGSIKPSLVGVLHRKKKDKYVPIPLYNNIALQ